MVDYRTSIRYVLSVIKVSLLISVLSSSYPIKSIANDEQIKVADLRSLDRKEVDHQIWKVSKSNVVLVVNAPDVNTVDDTMIQSVKATVRSMRGEGYENVHAVARVAESGRDTKYVDIHAAARKVLSVPLEGKGSDAAYLQLHAVGVYGKYWNPKSRVIIPVTDVFGKKENTGLLMATHESRHGGKIAVLVRSRDEDIRGNVRNTLQALYWEGYTQTHMVFGDPGSDPDDRKTQPKTISIYVDGMPAHHIVNSTEFGNTELMLRDKIKPLYQKYIGEPKKPVTTNASQ